LGENFEKIGVIALITDMTVISCVKNVAVSSEFWQKLGFRVALRQKLGAGHETVLMMYTETGGTIQLYDKAFIQQTQPELLQSRPFILFSADYIDDIYANLKAAKAKVSVIAPQGEQSYFTFLDPDNNRYTMIGEWVEKPLSDEKLTVELDNFDRTMRHLLPLTFEELENMTRPNFIFFGRRTCPWSRYMAKNFEDLKVRMYWVDTEGSDASHPVRLKYGIKTVPVLMKRASNGMYVKFDKRRGSVDEFLYDSARK
jgi:hypothetical protein